MGQSYPVLGQFLQWRLIYNVGGALGTSLGNNAFYLITSLLVLAIVIYFFLANRRNRIISLSMAIIAAGAIGNIIDRLRMGRVIDFIDMDFFNIDFAGFHLDRWWTYNIADAAITVGTIIFLLYILFFYRKQPLDNSPIATSNPSSSSP